MYSLIRVHARTLWEINIVIFVIENIFKLNPLLYVCAFVNDNCAYQNVVLIVVPMDVFCY
jgi:hypothetical protein